MVVLAGIVGAIVGFTIGILLTEVAFSSGASWPDVVAVALAVLGWLVGSSAARNLRVRRAATPR